jgi:hypothetical protein
LQVAYPEPREAKGEDDPEIFAAIRAAKSLAEMVKYLESPSGPYRYEAVKRIADLRLPISDLEKMSSSQESTIGNPQSAIGILRSLATEDAYEEIRAEAVLALDACDLKGRAGWDRLMADYAINFWSDPPPKEGWAYNTNRDRTERRHWVQLTLRVLGEQGRTRLERDFPDMARDPLRLRIAIDLATSLRWRIEGLVKAGLEVAQRKPLAATAPWRTQVPINTENPNVLPDYFAAEREEKLLMPRLAWFDVPAQTARDEVAMLKTWARIVRVGPAQANKAMTKAVVSIVVART